MAGSGQYIEEVRLDASSTTAVNFEVYGHGATVVGPTDQESPSFRIGTGFTKVKIKDLIVSQYGNVQSVSPVELDGVTVTNYATSIFSAGLTATDVTFGEGNGLEVSGQLTADRLKVISSTTAMFTGLDVDPGAVVNVKNLIVAGAAYQCVTLNDRTSGSITFATIADCGSRLSNTEGGPSAVKCTNSTVSLKSSIIWSLNQAYPAIDGCNYSQMIIGPRLASGASSADPQFVDFSNHDLRLKSASPAIDNSESGPPVDVAGVHRPQGARFDIGAYEYHP